MIVADANLIGNLFIQSKDSPLAMQVFKKDPDWYAPPLWQSEIRSFVTSYVRHCLLTLDKAYRIMDEAHRLRTDQQPFMSSNLVLELGRASKCTSYDWEYVA